MLSQINIIFMFFRAEDVYISVSSCKEQQMKEKVDLHKKFSLEWYYCFFHISEVAVF